MDVFKFNSYRELIKAYLKALPKKGRGERQKIAEVLTIHPTSLSQVLRGSKDFTLEQAGRLCQYLKLNELESEYLVCLIEIERAGSPTLKKIYEGRKQRLLEFAEEVNQRVPKDAVLTGSDKAKYYSQWYYTAIRLLCDIPGLQTPQNIAHHLRLPMEKVKEALNFLISIGFCIEENGLYRMNVQRNFLEKTSPLFTRHLSNWRQKAIQQLDTCDLDKDFVYTCPMTVSAQDREKVRAILLRTTEEILKLTLPSPSEELVLFNIDWLRI